MEEKIAARPFLKWSGGKTQLLPELLKRVPATFGTYHEPFLGAGALFFALQPQRAYLGDANGELTLTWKALQSCSEDVITELKKPDYANTPEAFYAIRASWPVGDIDATNAACAARMIYLNKTCFNGLYRVNRSGQFNAPYGKYPNPKICDEANLHAVGAVLQRGAIYIDMEGFDAVEARAVRDDFVYFDPPYIPLTKTSSFTAYTPGGFGLQQQTALRDLALRLKNRGVNVLLSNSGSPITEELYGKDFTLEPVAARRNINSKGTGRGAIKEYLIR